MIDTGSTRSFINNDKVNQFYFNFKQFEPFNVISTHATSCHDEVINIPLMPSFKADLFHKFYVYDVDKRHDGLIGLDLLTELEAVVNLKDKLLTTKNTIIPITYNPNLDYKVIIAPRSEQRVKLPTDLFNGDAILEYKEFTEGLRMPTALVNCINGYATTIIQNTLDTEMTIFINDSFKVIEYDSNSIINNTDVNNIDYNNTEVDRILTENLNLKIRLDHMNSEQAHAIQKLCLEYKDIFYCEQFPLTFTNQVKHAIRTTNEDPIYVKPYRQPQVVTDEINRQVEKLLKDNVIQESHSPWSAPVHLVPKKQDATGEVKHRMVIDYRRLNDITIDDRYPLPNITELFDKLGRSTMFSTLDLASGYHQVELREEDREKTAFSTQSGHWEFLRMPFGLKCAPATFQRAVNNVLRGLQGLHCMIYMDDIIIYSSSLEEHIKDLRNVFERLRATNLKVQLDKTEFIRKEVLYLGHQITEDGLKPNDDKIKAVLNYPIPKTTRQIKSFLGLVGYYRKFIKDFAKVTQPLTSCLKKRNRIIIDQKYIDAFNKCKELLTNAPILQYPDNDKPYILTTDASDLALGAVLSQGVLGSDKPIAYASRTLTDTESRYDATVKEVLAITWAVKHFRPYLYGKKFLLYTDHLPLIWLHSLKDPSSKLTRWRLKLQDFDFDIKHKPGKSNTNADALSRIKLPVNVLGSDDDDMNSTKVNVDDTEDRLQSYVKDLTNQIVSLTAKNKHNDSESTVTLSDSTRSASPIVLSDTSTNIIPLNKEPTKDLPYMSSNSSSTATAHSAVELDTTGIPILNEAVDTKPHQILVFTWFKNEMQVKDLSKDKQKILEVFLPENNLDLVKQFLKEYARPKIKYFIYFESDNHRRQFSNVFINLFAKGTVDMTECTKRVVHIEDESMQKEIIIKYHEGKTVHRGIKETVKRIKRNFYWNKMNETVSAVINGCELCQRMKYDRKPIKPTIQLTQTQDAPFQEVFIDLFSIDGITYLTLVDSFSKLGQAIQIPNKSTPEVVRALIKYFSYYGIPKRISSDPGSEFNNELMKELMKLYKIDLHIGTPNNPNSMGIVERFHSTIIEIYRLAKYEKRCTDAASVMTYAIMAYNHTIHSATDLTPFEVTFGHTDSGNIFDVDLEKSYMQHLLSDHANRTKYLYKHIHDKLVETKTKTREKRGGEREVALTLGQDIFVKEVNKRKSKDKPLYQKAIVMDNPDRNVIPIQVGQRLTKAPFKNVKRLPQVVVAGSAPAASEPQPGPSTSTT